MTNDECKFLQPLFVTHHSSLVIITGKLFYGEGTAAYQQWYEWAQQDLLSGGFALLEDRLAGLSSAERTADEREFLRRLRDYFSNHSERLCYRERLLEGRAIGSGEVEGSSTQPNDNALLTPIQ